MNHILLSTKWQLTRWGRQYFHQPMKNSATAFPVLSSERVEKINVLLKILSDKKPQWVRALKIHYIFQDKSSNDKVKLAVLPRRTYYHYVNKAEQWLSEQLT